jgi:hypothetical protein
METTFFRMSKGKKVSWLGQSIIVVVVMNPACRNSQEWGHPQIERSRLEKQAIEGFLWGPITI